VVDVVAEFPVEVIAELIGVPKEDRHKIFHWTNQVLGAADGGEVDAEHFLSEDQVARAQMEMFLYVRELCEQRRKEPRDDIMSELLRAQLEGHKLTDPELAAFFMFLSAAGNETTRSVASHGLRALSWKTRRSGTSSCRTPRGWPGSATEEILRWASPTMYLRRNVTADTELRGQVLKAGDKVEWLPRIDGDKERLGMDAGCSRCRPCGRMGRRSPSSSPSRCSTTRTVHCSVRRPSSETSPRDGKRSVR
jgi:methyl-branched lipid omega-hydroxylase